LASLVILLVGGALFLCLRPLANLSKRYGKDAGTARVGMAEELAESVASARDVRVFGVANRFRAQMRHHLRTVARARLKSLRASGAVAPVYRGVGLVVVIAVLGIGASIDSLDVASFAAVALLLLRSMSYGQQFQTAYNSAREATGPLELLN